MPVAVFGLGAQEILVLAVLGLVLLVLPLAIVLAVVLAQRRGPRTPEDPDPG